MFKKTFCVIAVSAVSLFSFSSISANAEEMPKELKSETVKQVEQIQYFDENDNPIHPYSNAEANPNPSAYSNNLYGTSTVGFGSTSFSNYVWIRDGQTFYNPQDVEFERINRPKSVSIYAYNSNGSYMGKSVTNEGTGWATVPWRHLPRGQSYKFKFVSESGQLVKIKHGTVYYN